MDRRSRRSSARLAAALALVIVAGVQVFAHRRDEYLQAARIDVNPARIAIELDVTPGIAIAPAAVATIDRDRDGLISEAEARVYAADVQSGLRLEIDGHPLPLDLIEVHAPLPIALMRGEGTIRIELAAAVSSLTPGRHRVFYRNDHHPADAAYLANALAPSSSRVEIASQHRDADQRELTIDVAIDDVATVAAPWLLGAGLAAEVSAIAGLGWMIRRSRRRLYLDLIR